MSLTQLPNSLHYTEVFKETVKRSDHDTNNVAPRMFQAMMEIFFIHFGGFLSHSRHLSYMNSLRQAIVSQAAAQCSKSILLGALVLSVSWRGGLKIAIFIAGKYPHTCVPFG